MADGLAVRRQTCLATGGFFCIPLQPLLRHACDRHGTIHTIPPVTVPRVPRRRFIQESDYPDCRGTVMQTRPFTDRLLRLLGIFSLFLAIAIGGTACRSDDTRTGGPKGTGQRTQAGGAGGRWLPSVRGLWSLFILLILASGLIVVLIRRRKRISVEAENSASGKAEGVTAGPQTAWGTEIPPGICEQYCPILEAIPDSVLLLTPDRKIVWTNAAAGARLGLEPAGLIGRYCHEVWHHRIGDGVCCPGRQCVSTGMIEASRGWTRDQQEFDIRAVPLKGTYGAVVCVVEIGREVTELHRIETQIRQSQKMELIGQLTGGIAHDFNNLLTAIMGFSYILQMKIPEHRPERVHLSRIISAAERAAVLTESLLSLSRKHTLVMSHVDLNQIVGGIEELLARLLGEDIELRITLSGTALPVSADRVLLGQVLLNLATNARDAMPRGGVLEIRTAAGRDGDRPGAEGEDAVPDELVILEVEDSGTGMDSGTAARVFEPFFTTKEDGKGTGLGLTIVQGIVRQHGGRIAVTSEPGRGTLFRVLLPRDAGGLTEPFRPAPPPPVGGSDVVLLVEDDYHTRDFVRELLSDYGYRVIEARDGREGVKRFLEQPDQISLLISDLVGPDKNGTQVYNELLMSRPDLKALFITGYPFEELLKRGIDTGDVPVLLKPFDPLEFLARVRSLLD